MKILRAMIVMFLLAVMFAFAPLAHATELTTEPPETTESTTQETSTEATNTTTRDEAIQVVINEDEIIIGNITISKSEAISLLAGIIEEYFGPQLSAMGWTAAGVAGAIIFVALWLIYRIKKNTLAQRDNATNSGTSISEVKTLKTDYTDQKILLAKSEARAAKSEAMNALMLDGITKIMTMSTNPAIAEASAGFKAEAQRVLAINDNISDFKQVVEVAAKSVAKAVVGDIIEKEKAKRALLTAALLNSSTKPEETNQG